MHSINMDLELRSEDVLFVDTFGMWPVGVNGSSSQQLRIFVLKSLEAPTEHLRRSYNCVKEP